MEMRNEDKKQSRKRKWKSWVELPVGPLIEISKKLNNYEDFEAFHLVCKTWYSALRQFNSKFQAQAQAQPQVPWLLLPQLSVSPPNDDSLFKPCTFLKECSSTSSDTDTDTYTHFGLRFYIMSSKRTREWIIRLPVFEVDFNWRDCYALSSQGWLLIVTPRLKSMFIVNPFRAYHDNYIPLPELQLSNVGTGMVHKFVLSDPEAHPYAGVVALLYDAERLALWDHGDHVWTCFSFSSMFVSGGIFDLTFFRGKFYGISRIGCIFSFSPPGPASKDRGLVVQNLTCLLINEYIPDYPKSKSLFPSIFMAYMAVQSDKLLLVVRVPLPETEHPTFYGTRGFKVFEIVLPMENHPLNIKEVTSLGNTSLFVGYNQSFFIEMPSEGNSSYYGCKPNRIYFTDDYMMQYFNLHQLNGAKDMGIFNMADGSIEQNFHGQFLPFIFPPIWVQPCS